MHNSCDEHDLFFLEAWDDLLESLSIRVTFIDFPGTGKPQESTASVWIDSKFEGYQLFLTEWADFTLAITIINMPKNERPSQEAGREIRVKRTNHILDWSSASENTKNQAETCEPVCFKCRDDKRRRRGTPWWMEVFVPVDFFMAASYGPLKQPECLWERSQEADPTPRIQMEISVCAFFPSAGPTPRKTSHLWNLWLFLSVLLGLDPVLGGESWTSHRRWIQSPDTVGSDWTRLDKNAPLAVLAEVNRCRMWGPGTFGRAFVLAAALKLLFYCTWRRRHRRCEGARSISQLERHFVSKLNIPPVCVYHFIFGSSFSFSFQTFSRFSHPTHSFFSFLPNAAWWWNKHVTCSVHLNATHSLSWILCFNFAQTCMPINALAVRIHQLLHDWTWKHEYTQKTPITLTGMVFVCKRLVLSWTSICPFQLNEESQLLFLHLKRMKHIPSLWKHVYTFSISGKSYEFFLQRQTSVSLSSTSLIHTLSGLSSAGKSLPSQMHTPFCPQPMESILLTCCNCLK